MEFDATYTPLKALFSLYFYVSLRPSIKLWINEKNREQLRWDDLIKKLIKSKAKARIQTSNSRDLDQQCPRGKRPLKLIKESKNKQPKKDQPKAPAALQAKPSPIRSEKETEATKKARKEKKRLAENNKNDKRAISRPQGPTQPLPARWPDNDNDG